tara:strand:+ start:2561 stop:3850 length:1290 start_codon:yes stop_codon:yes gene_type:complete
MSFDRMSSKFLSKNNNTVTAALDIGTDKIICLIVRNFISQKGDYNFEIIGIGHNQSRGMASGGIVDSSDLELAIRAAVESAEKMSSVTVDRIAINISTETVRSNIYEISIPIKEIQVTQKDIETALKVASEQKISDDNEIIQTIPLGFSIDGVSGIEDPIGMYAEKLDININVITCKRSSVQNLCRVVENAHAQVDKIVVSPISSAISTLTIDEANLGSILIDMGAGTTSFSVFDNGILKDVGIIPIGGNDITKDIARALSTPIEEAERLKILYGGVLTNSYDDGDLLTVPIAGYGGKNKNDQKLSKSVIADIARASILELFEKIKNRLLDVSESLYHDKIIVLTGGGSQLIGVDELAGEIFNGPIRRALPEASSDLFDISNPIFSNIIGLVTYSQNDIFVNKKITTQRLSSKSNNFLTNTINWFKDGF